ncbi:hypothetical protein DFJ74DRAFT_490208 [Hyaloraphidium curvatum]|nr:hypothetical protein DFJ74DRAFT_490208 [Hyaloraphidium curvatum]
MAAAEGVPGYDLTRIFASLPKTCLARAGRWFTEPEGRATLVRLSNRYGGAELVHSHPNWTRPLPSELIETIFSGNLFNVGLHRVPKALRRAVLAKVADFRAGYAVFQWRRNGLVVDQTCNRCGKRREAAAFAIGRVVCNECWESGAQGPSGWHLPFLPPEIFEAILKYVDLDDWVTVHTSFGFASRLWRKRVEGVVEAALSAAKFSPDRLAMDLMVLEGMTGKAVSAQRFLDLVGITKESDFLAFLTVYFFKCQPTFSCRRLAEFIAANRGRTSVDNMLQRTIDRGRKFGFILEGLAAVRFYGTLIFEGAFEGDRFHDPVRRLAYRHLLGAEAFADRWFQPDGPGLQAIIETVKTSWNTTFGIGIDLAYREACFVKHCLVNGMHALAILEPACDVERAFTVWEKLKKIVKTALEQFGEGVDVDLVAVACMDVLEDFLSGDWADSEYPYKSSDFNQRPAMQAAVAAGVGSKKAVPRPLWAR